MAAPLKDDIEGKSVSVSLVVLLTNASRMEELQNLWNDARVVTAGIWRVPPSNRESRSLKEWSVVKQAMHLEMQAFPDACIWRRMLFQTHVLLDASLSIFLCSYIEDI
jgi:hypothetical protein